MKTKYIFSGNFIEKQHKQTMSEENHEVGGAKRMARGSRAQVWHGTAKRTPGGLTKRDLFMNKHGRIVSRRKHFTAKKEMRLLKHGYTAEKGKFGPVRVGTRKNRRSRRGRRGMRGGDGSDPLQSAAGMLNAAGLNPIASMTGGRKRKRKGGMRGGMNGGPFSPADYAGAGVGTGGNSVQMAAGNSG